MFHKLDKKLLQVTVGATFFAIILYLLGVESEEAEYNLLFGILVHLFVFIPMLVCVKKEKQTYDRAQKVYGAIANAFFYSIIVYTLMHFINMSNDYIVIGLFIALVILGMFVSMGTTFISGFLYAYFVVLLIQFIGSSGGIEGKMVFAYSVQTIGFNLVFLGWIMAIVAYAINRPWTFSFKRSSKTKQRKPQNKSTKQKPNLKELTKPVFRKPVSKAKKKLRNYTNKA